MNLNRCQISVSFVWKTLKLRENLFTLIFDSTYMGLKIVAKRQNRYLSTYLKTEIWNLASNSFFYAKNFQKLVQRSATNSFSGAGFDTHDCMLTTPYIIFIHQVNKKLKISSNLHFAFKKSHFNFLRNFILFHLKSIKFQPKFSKHIPVRLKWKRSKQFSQKISTKSD